MLSHTILAKKIAGVMGAKASASSNPLKLTMFASISGLFLKEMGAE